MKSPFLIRMISVVNINSFDFNLLRVLDALLEERNVTRAGERLHLSQPAVSSALRRLRQAFEDPLFVRAQRGIIPTPRALALAPAVREVLARVGGMIDSRPFDPATADLAATVGANDYGQFSVIAPLLRILRGRAPAMTLRVVPLDADIGRQLQNHKADLAITLLTRPPPGTHSVPLFEENFLCAARIDHPALAGGGLTLDGFCALDHVRVSPANARLTDPVDQALAARGRSRRVVLTVPNFFLLPRMLRHSDLVSVIPARLARYFDWTISAVPPPLEIPGFTMNLVWHEHTHDSASHRWLRARMLEAPRMEG